MPSDSIKLSICIATFNRASYLRETLECIAAQISSDCEVIISDNASTDATESVATQFGKLFPTIRYSKQPNNVGLDRNFDTAVELARGEYCWLMPDDDILLPGAVSRILSALADNHDLIVTNYERRDLKMTNVLLPRFQDDYTDRVYTSNNFETFVAETTWLMVYIGSIIIRRTEWLSRNREMYFDSMWIHLGVVLQRPFPRSALVISDPLVSYRDGNTKTYSSHYFEIVEFKLAALIWSLPIGEDTKRRVVAREPWRNIGTLLRYRAFGSYAPSEYQRLIRPHLKTLRERTLYTAVAHFPGIVLNAGAVIYYSLSRARWRLVVLQLLKDSPFFLKPLQLLLRNPQPVPFTSLDGPQYYSKN